MAGKTSRLSENSGQEEDPHRDESAAQCPDEEGTRADEKGALGAISPSTPQLKEPRSLFRGQQTSEPHAITNGKRGDEDDSPQSAMSISLSVSEVETAVLEGLQLGEMITRVTGDRVEQTAPTGGR